MRRLLTPVALVLTIILVSAPCIAQMCTQIGNTCISGPFSRDCFRMFVISGTAPMCTGVNVVAPATSFYSYNLGGFFFYATCYGPIMNTAGSCQFNGCGACGSFTVNMFNGLPVELLDFEIVQSPADAPDETPAK